MKQFDKFVLNLENRYNKRFTHQSIPNLRGKILARKNAPIGPVKPIEPVKPVDTDVWEPREMTAQTPSIFRALYGIIKNHHGTNLADAKAASLDFLHAHRDHARFTEESYEHIITAIDEIKSFAELYRYFVILITRYETPEKEKSR